MPATAWAWRAGIDRFNRFGIIWRWRDVEEPTRERDAGLARGRGEQAIVADAVEALGQNVEQEAADKLVCCQRHDLLPVRAVASIVLEAQGDALPVERDQAPVRDGNAVGVTRQIGEHSFGTSERRLGIDDPSLLPNGRQMAQERTPVGKMRQMAEVGQLAALV